MPSWSLAARCPTPCSPRPPLTDLEAGEGLIRLLQHYATPFLEQNLLGSGAAVAIGLLLYPFLFLLALRRVARTRPRPPLALWVWALYPWLYLVTFAIPNPLIFRWYLTPPLPAYFFFIFIGLDALFTGLGSSLSAHLRRGRAGHAGQDADEPTPDPPRSRSAALLTALRQRDTQREREVGVNFFGVIGDGCRQ